MKAWLTPALILAALAGPTIARGTANLVRPSARELLELAHHAAGHVSFCGRQLTVMWNRRETIATVTQEYHSNDGRLRIETVMPLAARGRVVVDNGRDRWQYEPSRHVIYHSPAVTVAAGPPVDQLLLHYTASVAPRPEVTAGRRVWRLELTPHLASKATRRMWIDAATGLVLRYEQANANGRMMSTSRFSDIRIGEPASPLFARPGPAEVRVIPGHAAPVPITLASARARFGVPLPAVLPAGYTFADATLLYGKGRPMAHLRYRDGLNAVSLYVAPRGGLPSGIRAGKLLSLQHGTGRLQCTRHFYVLSWRGVRGDFALVGDTSPEMLALLANGTALTAGAAPVPLELGTSDWLLAVALLLLGLSGIGLAHRRSRRLPPGAGRPLPASPGG